MLKKWLRSPIVSVALFALAAGLILFGGIRGVQAAPRIQSTWFGAEVELDDIDVALTETCVNDGDTPRVVHGTDALVQAENFLPEGEEFSVGTTYTEKLAVRNMQNSANNSGGADGNGGDQLIKEYVRVTLYRYWATKNDDGDYVKNPDLNPKYIEVEFDQTSGWTLDSSAHTDERDVLYYGSIVYAGDDTTAFTKSVKINSAVLKDSAYKDAQFRIEAVVDAVQTHNAADAMMSAWGKNNMIAISADSED